MAGEPDELREKAMKKLLLLLSGLMALSACSVMQPACGCIDPNATWPPAEQPEGAYSAE